jgi:Fe-S cluster assembly protein SufD
MNTIAGQTVTAPPSGFDEAAFEAFLETRDEPDWLINLRRAAFAAYQEKLVTPLDPEEWKRVDLRTFRPEQFAIKARSDSSAKFSTLLRDRAEFSGNVSHVDGTCTGATLDAGLAARGVLFGDLTTLAREHGDVLRPHLLKRAVKADADRFAAWHAEFMTGGTVLYVPAGVEVTQPLHSLIGLSQAGAADFSHTLVILERGASATLLEETVSANPDAQGLHVGAVELLLAEDSKLRYVQLQNWNEQTWHLAHQAGNVDRGAFLQWTVAGIGSKLAHVHQHVALDGEGAEAEVNGVTFAVDRQRISYYTQQAHNAPHTRSDLLYKQVLRDRSRVVWRGMIRVEPEAQKTDGYQRCDALLLSPTCRNDAIPGLEIEADDVRCTHGATAGRVDEEQVFYCMCRGMTEFEAMHIIVEGFFRTVYDRIPVEVVRETLGRAVERKLGIGR